MQPDTMARQEATAAAAPAAAMADMLEEDLLRAGTYALLGTLLAAPPNEGVLERLRGIEAGAAEGDGLAASWQLLKQAGMSARPEELADEYHDLFIGIGRGELVPYASWYLTGFLMERPLAQLRHDLARYGIEARPGVSEPEDHVAALCESMAVVIERADTDAQQAWFDTHLASWMDGFFRDLQQARNARFYRAVGLLGEQFMQFERQYLALPD